MKNSTRKVVILENITSPYIQQAIIVLNECASLTDSKVITDAERIVTEYLNRNGYHTADRTKIYRNKKKNHKKIWGYMLCGFLFSFLIISFMIKR